MKTQAWVLNRIEQSFELMKNHFFPLILPLITFHIGVYYVFYFLVLFFSGKWIFDSGNFTSIFVSSNYILFFLSLLILGIYLLLAIGVTIGLIRSIGDAYHGRPIDMRVNYLYGRDHIVDSFRTYYLIFLYVYAIPALIVIVWGLWILSVSPEMISDIFWTNKRILVILGIGGLLFFTAYRGLRTTFSFMASVDRDEYSKNAFDSSVSLTDGQWWRILGNTILVGFLISLASGIVSSFIPADSSFVGVPSWTDLTSAQVVSSIQQSAMVQAWDIFRKTIGVVGILFSAIFSYVLLKRLEEEKSSPIE